MARKSPSRVELRKQAEAAESKKSASGADGAKKKATKKKKKAARSKRAKDKTPQRRRLVWAIFNASMKEEARFPYDQREEAEKKIKQLHEKSKKPYFIQPIKEPITESPPTEQADTAAK